MPKKKAANGYNSDELLPSKEVLEDVAKKKWIIGEYIQQVGSSKIYTTYEASKKKNIFIVKVDFFDSVPLLNESNFYVQAVKIEDVKQFKTEKGLQTFGMPTHLGTGSHTFNNIKYRFIVMEKYGPNLWNKFIECNKHFPTTTVFKIAIQILDVLEYIHSKGYVHSNIKPASILLGTTKQTLNKQVFLVDFQLVSEFNKEEEPQPASKFSPDGTILYISRDEHNGVKTVRGDLEALSYNLIEWLGCELPWEKDLDDSIAVQTSKQEYMKSTFKFIKACFDNRSPPGAIVDFLNYISTLDLKSHPDYKHIRKIFLSALDPGDTLKKPFNFTVPEKSSTKPSPIKRKNNAANKSPIRKKRLRKDTENDNKDKKVKKNNKPVKTQNIDMDEDVPDDVSEISDKSNEIKNDTEKEHKDDKDSPTEKHNEEVNISDEKEEIESTNINNEKQENLKPPKKTNNKKATSKKATNISEDVEDDKGISNTQSIKNKATSKRKKHIAKSDQLPATLENNENGHNQRNTTEDLEDDLNEILAEKKNQIQTVKNNETEKNKIVTAETDDDKTESEKPKKKMTDNKKEMVDKVGTIRVTRRLAQVVSYKEDSDEDQIHSKKQQKNAVTKHVTGDNAGGFKVTKRIKNAKSKKTSNNVDEQS